MAPWPSPSTSDPLRTLGKNKREVGFSHLNLSCLCWVPIGSKSEISFSNEEDRKWGQSLNNDFFTYIQQLCAHQHSTRPGSGKMPPEIPQQTPSVLKEGRDICASSLSLPLIPSAHGPWVRTSIWMENNNWHFTEFLLYIKCWITHLHKNSAG